MGRKRGQTQALSKMKKKLGVQVSKFDAYLEYLNGTKLHEELTSEQQEMFDKYSVAWSLANIGRTDDMIEAALQKKYPIKTGMARIIRIESFELFGSVEDVGKKGRITAAINYFKTLSNLARAQSDFKTATMAWKEASLLEGLYQQDSIGFKLDDFKTPPVVVFTSNINVLKASREELEDDE